MWSEFARPTREQWQAQVDQELKGKPGRVPLYAEATRLPLLTGAPTVWCECLDLQDERCVAAAREAAEQGAGMLSLTWPSDWPQDRLQQALAQLPELPCVSVHHGLAVQEIAHDDEPPTDGKVWLSTEILAERGATAAQELAYGLDAFVRIFAQDARPERYSWVLAAGPQLFEELAKLRAARILWSKLMVAHGWAAPARLQVVQSRLTYTVSDPDTNLLRSAAAAWVACLGGAETLRLLSCGPARRTRNQLHVFLQEGFLQRVQDPVAGSYFVDARSDELAREAWQRMQSGDLGDVEASFREQLKRLSTDKASLVGTTRYVPPGALPAAASEHRLAAPFEALRRRAEGLTARLVQGPGALAQARADFARSFLAIGGIVLADQGPWTVICHEEPEGQVAGQEGLVVVAAAPPEQPAAPFYIHRHSDRLETLDKLLEAVGR